MFAVPRLRVAYPLNAERLCRTRGHSRLRWKHEKILSFLVFKFNQFAVYDAHRMNNDLDRGSFGKRILERDNCGRLTTRGLQVDNNGLNVQRAGSKCCAIMEILSALVNYCAWCCFPVMGCCVPGQYDQG